MSNTVSIICEFVLVGIWHSGNIFCPEMTVFCVCAPLFQPNSVLGAGKELSNCEEDQQVSDFKDDNGGGRDDLVRVLTGGRSLS